MTINHLFLAFMAVVGAAVGIILVVKPEARDFRVSPYFWVLLAWSCSSCWRSRADAPRNGRDQGCQGQRIPDGDRADGGDTDRVGLVGGAVLIGAAAVASVRPPATSERAREAAARVVRGDIVAMPRRINSFARLIDQ